MRSIRTYPIKSNHNILKNKDLNSFFNKYGYVKFQLFSDEEVCSLQDYYQEIKNHFLYGQSYATSTGTGDLIFAKKVSDYLLKNFFSRSLEKHLINYDLTLSSILVKQPGSFSIVKPHQDLLLVDEPDDISFNCWVSLQDSNKKNGNLQFIPGSHLFKNSIRSAHTDFYFDKLQINILDYMIDVPAQKGECILFSNSTIHASRENKSKYERVALVAGGINKGAKMYFHHKALSQNTIEKYLVDNIKLLEFITNAENIKNTLKPIKYIPGEIDYITDKEFIDLCSYSVDKFTVLKNKLYNHLKF